MTLKIGKLQCNPTLVPSYVLLYILCEAIKEEKRVAGEHFGMAVVEVMAAGLITIVPSIGTAEFVPQQYQFHTVDHAAEIIT